MKRRSVFSFVAMVLGSWFAAGRLQAATTTATVAPPPVVPELSDVPSALLVLSGLAGLFGYRRWRSARPERHDSEQA